MNERLVLVDQEVETKEGAVELAGSLLRDEGYVTSHYVEQMVYLLNEFGPYIVITKHVAMPHARPTDGALRSGFSILRLKKAINFGNKDNDPVQLVIGLSATTNEEHLQTIQKICILLEDEIMMETLQKGTLQEILTEMRKRNV